MERRDFFSTLFGTPSRTESDNAGVRLPAPENTTSIAPFTGGINPYTGSWTAFEVSHLLKRLMFGATMEDVNFFKTLSISDAVDALLNTTASTTALGQPLKVVNTDPDATPADPDWSVPLGRPWVNTVCLTLQTNRDRRESLKAWWLQQMIRQPRSIEEKMILFWSTFVTIEFGGTGNAIMCWQYLQLLRQYATGNFKSLIKDITTNGAMLVYLNGYLNTKQAPDENYARELQELFTLGKGPESQYTEDDVKAAARALTGFGVNLQTGAVQFNLSRHDTNPKQFSAFYNNTIINRPSTEAALELDDLVNMIFAKDEVSKFFCRRLYRFFVYHDISADTEANIIAPLAATLRSNNYDIKPVLAQLFKSEHFFDVLQNGAVIKSPVDFLVGMIRECDIKLPPFSNPVLLYRHLNYISSTYLPSVEQGIGDPINVAGYPAYYQTPLFDKLWINADTWIKRQTFADTLINAGYSNGGFKTIIDATALARKMSDPANPNTLIADLGNYFLRRTLSQSFRDSIKTEILLTGQSNDSYWTAAWNEYLANPADLNTYTVVNNRLKSLLQLFMVKLEDYHLM